uniref:Uncharacterized protein n=1 Tax=Physcomitrium patens TaxID=3218 RepID=A0A2K1IIN7_PHYPA|nr:hypothetical protein PHYPA_027835 [Physcomitrium patens]
MALLQGGCTDTIYMELELELHCSHWCSCCCLGPFYLPRCLSCLSQFWTHFIIQ